VNLHPAGYSASSAEGVWGGRQAGWARTTGNANHAVLWSGTAQSAVDLHPAGFAQSRAWGIGPGQQVGSVETEAGDTRAVLWTGTVGSMVDLHPAAPDDISEALATNGRYQVGYAGVGPASVAHAVLWEGTAQSVVDLGALLPGRYDQSAAYGIDAAGNVVGTAWDFQTNTEHAVVWLVVPEPGSGAAALLASAGLLFRRNRRRTTRHAGA
jgi:hypothetical protein